MRTASALFVVILGATGALSCSSSSSQGTASSPKSGPITELTPTVSVQQTPHGTRIFGPQLELVRDDQGIRGQSPRGAVNLTEEKGGFTGLVGAGPTNLHVEPAEQGNFTLRGMFAGSLGELEVRDDRIQGQLGRCQFDLRGGPAPGAAPGAGKFYNGQRVCGGAMRSTTLTLSPQIEALTPLDRGALIAIVLTQ